MKKPDPRIIQGSGSATGKVTERLVLPVFYRCDVTRLAKPIPPALRHRRVGTVWHLPPFPGR
jgi:hypothetical protein